MKRYLPFLIIIAVAAGAVGGSLALYREKMRERRASSGANSKVAEGAVHVRGPADPVATVVEFGDFQCPPCAKLAAPLDQLIDQHAEQVRFVFRQLPLAMHKHAREAAYAAEAAALQGKFWEMHDILYREQSAWAEAADVTPLFENYATKIGLNLERFRVDRAGDAAKNRVAFDEKRAQQAKIEATPTIFINDQLVPPTAFNQASLRSLLERAVKK